MNKQEGNMINKQELPPTLKVVENYKDALMYKNMQSHLEQGKYDVVLKYVQYMTATNSLDSKYENMLSTLIEADSSNKDAINLQFKKTVEEFFQELSDKGLLLKRKGEMDIKNSAYLDGLGLNLDKTNLN